MQPNETRRRPIIINPAPKVVTVPMLWDDDLDGWTENTEDTGGTQP